MRTRMAFSVARKLFFVYLYRAASRNYMRARIHKALPNAWPAGSVILHVQIGKDGNVHDMNLVEGQCEFAKSAMEAVQKWRYSPTLLNGSPVEVDTTITVNYKLGGP
jgi:TonB family protein